MIDLRSDTVTLPTENMREAMRRAVLGDNSRDGDPTVRRLEEVSAKIVSKEAALFVASGTMANLVALLAHADRGGEVLLDESSHIMRSELGGVSQLAGLFPVVYPADRGTPDAAAVRELIHRKTTPSRIATALICVETTHNDAGGAVLPLACLSRLRAVANENDVAVHIDGARLFNAAVALGVSRSRSGAQWRQRSLLREQGIECAGRLGALRQRGIHRTSLRLPPDGRRRDAPGGCHRRRRNCRAGGNGRTFGRRPQAGTCPRSRFACDQSGIGETRSR